MSEKAAPALLCPSVTVIDADAQVFGVLTGPSAEELQVGYLTKAVPVTPDLLAAAAPANATQVFRAAAPCLEHGCKHFDGVSCQLATRVISMLDPVVSALPRCAIRSTCRWFRQGGREACLRCPQMATERHGGSELQRAVAG